MFQLANPTKVIPDLVKLVTGTLVSFPDYPCQSLLQGSLHTPPPFFSTSKTHASKEKRWDKVLLLKRRQLKQKKLIYLDHFHLSTHSGSCNSSTPFLQRFSQQTRKLLLWSLTHLLDDNIFWKGHCALRLKSKCSFYLSDKGKAQSCCEEEENSLFPAFFDVL